MCRMFQSPRIKKRKRDGSDNIVAIYMYTTTTLSHVRETEAISKRLSYTILFLFVPKHLLAYRDAAAWSILGFISNKCSALTFDLTGAIEASSVENVRERNADGAPINFFYLMKFLLSFERPFECTLLTNELKWCGARLVLYRSGIIRSTCSLENKKHCSVYL